MHAAFRKTWRTLFLLLFFLAGESVLYVHQQDMTLHGHDDGCAVCLHTQISGSLPDPELAVIQSISLRVQVVRDRRTEVIPAHFSPDHPTRASPEYFS